MNTLPSVKNYICYDPERVDYSVNEEELNNLKNAGQNHWKDVTLVSLAIGIPCVINGFSEMSQQETFIPTFSIVLNFIIGGIGLGFTMIFGICWGKTYNSINKIIEKIKNKPKFEVPDLPNVTDVGKIEGKE